MEKLEYLPVLKPVLKRCEELAHAEIKDDAWKEENEKIGELAQQLLRMSDRIKTGPVFFFDPSGMTEIQRRIMYAARFQKSADHSGRFWIDSRLRFVS